MKIKTLLLYFVLINILTYILLLLNFFILYDRMGDGTYLISTLNVLILLSVVDIFLIVIYKVQRKKDEEQKKFITNSIHTLRTPINIINANVEIIELDYTNDLLNNIKTETEKLEIITSNLMKYTIFKERDFLNPSKVNISNILNEEFTKVKTLLEANNKNYLSNINLDIYWYISSTRAMVLLTTLLDNACKYSMSKVECNLTDKFLEIINDTNLKDGNYIHLFERFKRDEKEVKGFGVGLSIVHSICSDNKIKLEANVINGKMIIRLNKNKMDIN